VETERPARPRTPPGHFHPRPASRGLLRM